MRRHMLAGWGMKSSRKSERYLTTQAGCILPIQKGMNQRMKVVMRREVILCGVDLKPSRCRINPEPGI